MGIHWETGSTIRRWWLLLCLLCVGACASAETVEHPSLLLTKPGAAEMRANLGRVPAFDVVVEAVKREVDAEIQRGIDVPTPRDFSGGYTHEQHKRNFLIMPKAGALFQVLGDERYAIYLRDMLFAYERMYPTLPLHPQERSYARGKLFWQCLNDANWLLYASQGYDSIYEWLSPQERDRLEQNLFRPFADFLSIENPQFFNRVHNHSTWGTAAVGMIGLVMRDDDLVQRALYGLDDQSIDPQARDNDGGFIREADQPVGFLANLAQPFSPDGYYTEGPYYQRYAMYPFLVFAQSLNNVRPDLGVMGYRDGVLLKAIDALVNLTDADGEFFPLNDAQKGMSLLTGSLVAAVDIAYASGDGDPRLLGIAERQGRVTLDDAGFAVARALSEGKSKPFQPESLNLSDGPEGQQGGVAVLRAPADPLTLVFKYSAQGLSHGHYDKLSFSLYDGGDEVLQDYGLVRFVNIEQKGGGNYLPENSSWAKQTIAHNTVTQDQISQFEGRYEIGSQHHSELAFFDASQPQVQIISATDNNAYPGTAMQRTMALISDEDYLRPFVLDLFRIRSDEPHRYDLPYWYIGQHLGADVEMRSNPAPTILGDSNGYQHLLVEAVGAPSNSVAQFQWFSGTGFYTLTSATRSADEWLFTRIGANDPDFNLRRDPALIIRRDETAHTLFAQIIEVHGSYSPVTELTKRPRGDFADVVVALDTDAYSAVRLTDRDGRKKLLVVAHQETKASAQHEVVIGGNTIRWQGPYHYQTLD